MSSKTCTHNEKKLKTLEKERPDALEVAAQKDEEREKKTNEEIARLVFSMEIFKNFGSYPCLEVVVIKKIKLRHKKKLSKIKQDFNKEFHSIVAEIQNVRKEQETFFTRWNEETLKELRKL